MLIWGCSDHFSPDLWSVNWAFGLPQTWWPEEGWEISTMILVANLYHNCYIMLHSPLEDLWSNNEGSKEMLRLCKRSISSQPSQLFKIVWQLLMSKSEPLLSQEDTISCDTFARFFADKILRKCLNTCTPEERPNIPPGLFMDHFDPVSTM